MRDWRKQDVGKSSVCRLISSFGTGQDTAAGPPLSAASQPIVATDPSPQTVVAGQNKEQQIRALAYQLYEERGRRDGYAELDWFEAEKLVRNQ